ncbi:MAG TPA: hypothetical protein VMW38_20325 [Terriglobia bacterium]|nr:hypothetical protein [Terriglobia bacterium]
MLTVRPMIAAVPPLHQGILPRFSFHITAGQIIEQHVKFRPEQLPITLFQVSLDLGLVRNQPIQTPVQPGVVDRACRNSQPWLTVRPVGVDAETRNEQQLT